MTLGQGETKKRQPGKPAELRNGRKKGQPARDVIRLALVWISAPVAARQPGAAAQPGRLDTLEVAKRLVTGGPSQRYREFAARKFLRRRLLAGHGQLRLAHQTHAQRSNQGVR